MLCLRSGSRCENFGARRNYRQNGRLVLFKEAGGNGRWQKEANSKVEDVDFAAAEDKEITSNVAEEKSPYRADNDGYRR